MKKMLEDILKKLNTAFLSEADFQFTIAWEINRALKGKGGVILEYPEEQNGQRAYYDIFVKDEAEKTHLIELKYRTKKAEVERYGKSFTLKNQSAHDLGRYHFIKDIERLETQNIATGNSYCIMLTNDDAYKVGETGNTNDKCFRFGSIIPGNKKLDWNDKPEERKKYCKNLKPITLIQDYHITWRDYKLMGKCSEFQYLLLEIPPKDKGNSK